MSLVKRSLFPLVVLLGWGVVLLVVLAARGVEGHQIQCYVCSWQKPSRNFSVVDNCTHNNFVEGYAAIVNCSKGCEAVTYRHSKNDGRRRPHLRYKYRRR